MVTEDSGGNRTQLIAQKHLGSSVGSWIHVVGTYNKTTGEQKLYVNGLPVNTVIHPAGNTIVPLSSDTNMRIGSMALKGFFYGTIDELRLYSRELSAQEVIGLFNL